MRETSYTAVFNDSFGGFEVCVKNDRAVGSLGIWVGDNPFDFVVPITLCQIFLTVLISRALQHVLRPLHTPRFVSCVLGGILLGPSCLGRNVAFLGTLFPPKQATFLMTCSKIATAYSVFLITLKMDVVTTLKSSRRCWRFGIFPFFASYFATVILLALYKPNNEDKATNDQVLTVPNVFTLSSFAVVSEALSELNLISTELGQIGLSSSLISEMAQWVTIAFQFKSDGDYVTSFGFSVLVGLFISFNIFIVRPMMKNFVKRTPIGKPLHETYVVIILLGVLVMAAVSDIIGLYFVIGPSVYGLVMPNGPPLATTIIERSEVIISEFLMPFFYIYIGINTDLTGILQHWHIALVFQGILFVGFLVKVLTCVFISPTYNIKPKHGAVLGLILSVKGLIELIFFARIRRLQIINQDVFSQMVLYVLLMTSFCVPVIKAMYKHHPRVSKTQTIHEGRVRRIQNIPEHTEFNVVSCVHSDGNVHSMIGLLEACSPTIESPICVYVIHLVELLGKSTPILFPMNMNKKQNRKSLSINYPNTNHILRAFENYANNTKGPVTILSHVNVAPYSSMHDAVSNLAEDKSVHFLVVPFHENDQSLGPQINSSIRDVNTNFLVSAKCTVGILVDRNSQLSSTSGSGSNSSFNVGVFFIGGADDREALALGIRMLEKPNTSVTLFRFVLRCSNLGVMMENWFENDEEEGMMEGSFDESLVDEFKAKKINSDNVVCHEIEVEDCIQVVEAIRRMEQNDDYDLVMVGKRHNIGDVSDEEMLNFMDNADQLGIVGDILVSSEFCNGKAVVLVMQCGEKRQNKFQKVGSTLLVTY